MSSLIILKRKIIKFEKFVKFLIFFFGFIIIVMSELTYKFINSKTEFEIISLSLPLFLIFIFYFCILIKTNFKLRYL